MSAHLPDVKSVRDILSGVLGRDVTVENSGPRVQSPEGALLAGYVNQPGTLCAIVALDLAATASFGAAIALTPPKVAADAIADGAFPDDLTENAGEVLNILASAFNVEGAPHMRLAFTYTPGRPAPASLVAWLAAYVPRLDLGVTPTGYPSGRLSLLVLP